MKLPILGIVSVFTLCVAINARADTPQDSNRHDPKLDGVWVLKSIERGGTAVEGDSMPERMRGTTRTINGTEMILSRGGGTRQLKLAIAVDTSGKRKQMDISAVRDGNTRVLKCIYEIKGDVLRIAENATERPESFESAKSTTRTMVTTHVRKREGGTTEIKATEPSDQNEVAEPVQNTK